MTNARESRSEENLTYQRVRTIIVFSNRDKEGQVPAADLHSLLFLHCASWVLTLQTWQRGTILRAVEGAKAVSYWLTRNPWKWQMCEGISRRLSELGRREALPYGWLRVDICKRETEALILSVSHFLIIVVKNLWEPILHISVSEVEAHHSGNGIVGRSSSTMVPRKQRKGIPAQHTSSFPLYFKPALHHCVLLSSSRVGPLLLAYCFMDTSRGVLFCSPRQSPSHPIDA